MRCLHDALPLSLQMSDSRLLMVSFLQFICQKIRVFFEPLISLLFSQDTLILNCNHLDSPVRNLKA